MLRKRITWYNVWFYRRVLRFLAAELSRVEREQLGKESADEQRARRRAGQSIIARRDTGLMLLCDLSVAIHRYDYPPGTRYSKESMTSLLTMGRASDRDQNAHDVSN